MVRAWIFIALAAILAACGGLGGQPEIVSTLPPPTPESLPIEAPNITLGEQLFASHCTECHGINGTGDGELVLNGSVPQPGNFNDPAFLQDKSPLTYFNVITNGRIENLMPPWANALTTEERWAVTMYVYSLHYGDLATGESLITSTIPAAYSVPGNTESLTDEDLANAFTSGEITTSPTWAELSQDEQNQAIAYVRSLSLSQDVATEITPTQATVLSPGFGTVTGLVTAGTQSMELPDDLVVTLRVFDPDFNETTFETTLNEDNTFRFEDVAFEANRVYLTTTQYNGWTFYSRATPVDPTFSELELNLMIYETTDDPDVIDIVSRLTQIQPTTNQFLEVVELVYFINTSDKLYVGENGQPGETLATLRFNLPPGAVVTVIEEDRYVVDQQNFVITDTFPIQPDVEQLFVVSYLMPYDDGAIIEYDVNNRFNGPMRLLVNSEQIGVQGSWVQGLGTEVLGGVAYQVYGGALNLQPGDTIRYELTGNMPQVGTSRDSSVVTSDNLLPIVLIAVLVLLIIIGTAVFLLNRRSTPISTDANQLIDALLRQIAELDAQHEAGEINHDLYQHRRKQLKTRLEELTGNNDTSNH